MVLKIYPKENMIHMGKTLILNDIPIQAEPDFESIGRGFESLRAYHLNTYVLTT